MRILVHGNYEGKAFVLRTEDGKIHQSIEPETKLSIGDSHYFSKKIFYSRQPMLALIKLGNGMAMMSLPELKRKTRIHKGFILKPGKGFWAISSGSARRGIWHVIKGVIDPICAILWAREISSKMIRVVDEIDVKVYEGGNLCEHARAGAYDYHCLADGSTGELHKATHGKHAHDKFCQIKEASVLVVGGTYCIQLLRRKEHNGKVYPHLVFILLTPEVNRVEVARLLEPII